MCGQVLPSAVGAPSHRDTPPAVRPTADKSLSWGSIVNCGTCNEDSAAPHCEPKANASVGTVSPMPPKLTVSITVGQCREHYPSHKPCWAPSAAGFAGWSCWSWHRESPGSWCQFPPYVWHGKVQLCELHMRSYCICTYMYRLALARIAFYQHII